MATQPRQVEEPEYRRLATALRRDIQNSRWVEGQPLPTDSELETQFKVSRQTVRRAYMDLVNEGLVYRAPGRGTFLTPSHLRYRRPFESVDDLLALSTDTDLEIIAPLVGTFDSRATVELQLKTRLMYGMRFLRRHEGTVFCHTSIHLPPAVGALLEHDGVFAEQGVRTAQTVIGALSNKGIQISGAEQSITAHAANPLLSQQLGCPEGHPMLHVERLYFDVSGRPVEWAVSDFLPEHYTHRLHLGRRLSALPPPQTKPPAEGAP